MKGEDNRTEAEQVWDTIQEFLATPQSLREDIGEREMDIIHRYYGFKSFYRHSLVEIGQVYDISRERVRQIKHHAIKKLKHTKRRR